LGVIVCYADLLLEDYGTLPAEMAQRALAAVSHSGRKAGEIIDSLLVLASVRQQDVQAVPLKMADVIDEVWLRLANALRDSDADLHLPDRASWPIALGYAPWVEEIWVNYLSNAIKYGGPRPHIELSAVRQPDGFVRFSVRDYGAGLTLEQQQRLFAPFERLSQVQIKGHGLGLSVVRRITDKLGGQAGVDSQPGQGSTFYFTLPAASTRPAPGMLM
jgi:signal transduction histidine kinase